MELKQPTAQPLPVNFLTYGIGIFSDFSSLDFNSLIFTKQSVSVQARGGEVKRLIAPLSRAFPIDNYYDYHTLEYPTDIFHVRVSESGPVELDIRQTAPNTAAIIYVDIDDGVSCKIVEKLGMGAYCGLLISVRVGKNAHCSYIAGAGGSDSRLFALRTAHVSSDSSFDLFDLHYERSMTKSSTYINLAEPGARGTLKGLFFGSGNEQYDIYNVIEHRAAHTASNMEVKGALDDRAKAIYRGLIRIHKGANKADGAQQEHTLLLSDRAQISSVPELEIEHDDVKCSHAVSTTSIDKYKLFYMNSRGISTSEARRALVLGHFSSILDGLDDAELREAEYARLTKKCA